MAMPTSSVGCAASDVSGAPMRITPCRSILEDGGTFSSVTLYDSSCPIPQRAPAFNSAVLLHDPLREWPRGFREDLEELEVVRECE